jgi:hypothetical protein
MATVVLVEDVLYNDFITITQVILILDKAKPDAGNVRDLNLAVVKHMTVQVTRQPL